MDRKRASGLGIAVALLAFVPISAAHAAPNLPNPNFGIGGFAAGVSPTALVDGDFNQDGNTDIAVANSSSGDVTIETSADGHQFSLAASIYLGGSPFSITTADFNADHDPDLVVANAALGTVQILLGGSGATFAAPVAVPVAFFPATVAVADLNADTHPDLVVGTQASDGGVFTLRGLGGTAFAKPTLVHLNGVQSVVVADFNADHDPDVAAATTDDRIALLLGGPGTTLGTPTFATGIGPGPRHMLSVGNFNADTDPDLAVVNGGNEDLQGNVSILLGGPGKTFAKPVQYAAGDGFLAGIAVGDLDNDGIQDVVVTDYATREVTLLFGNGAGKFAAPFFVPEGGTGPVAVVVTNFDDNLPDLAVANNQSANVSILINFGPGRHADSPAPDLVVRGVSWAPTNPAPGAAVKFKAKVTNVGDRATPAGVVVGVSFEVDGTQVSWSAYLTTAIPAGGTVYLGATGGPHGPAWFATPGTHVVRAVVDTQRRIFELDELNNAFTTTITVK